MALRPPPIQVQRVVSALVVVREDGWKPVINLRSDNCSLFIGFSPERDAFDAMITDRRQGTRARTAVSQSEALVSQGWSPPSSEMVRAFERSWPLDDDEGVAAGALAAMGVYGWTDRDPLWLQLTFNRLPRQPLALERALAVLTPFTLIVLHPHIEPHQTAARARCVAALDAGQCDLAVQAKRGRALERIARGDESGVDLTRSITHLLHPNSPTPDWMGAWGQPR